MEDGGHHIRIPLSLDLDPVTKVNSLWTTCFSRTPEVLSVRGALVPPNNSVIARALDEPQGFLTCGRLVFYEAPVGSGDLSECGGGGQGGNSHPELIPSPVIQVPGDTSPIAEVDPK